MKISFALANKLASFKNQKQPFETGSEYKLNYDGKEATEETIVTIDESREMTVGALLNLFVSVNTEKVGEYTFMKKGERAITLGEQLANAAKEAGNEAGFDLPTELKVIQRVTVGTTTESVDKLENAATIQKGYELCKIDITPERIPQLWATTRKDAKYDTAKDFKVRTKIVVSAS